MSKYQKGAIYRVKIPDDFVLRNSETKTAVEGEEDREAYRSYWDGKLFKMTQHGCLGIETTRGICVDEFGKPLNSGNFTEGCWHGHGRGKGFAFWKSWLAERVDTYTSPFDGQVK